MTFFSAAGIFASGQYLPTYVQTSLGSSATVSGLLVAPQAIGNLLSSVAGGQLVARTGRFKLQMIVGTALMAGGAFLTTRFGAHESLYYIAAITVLMGFGGGFVFPVTQVVVQGAVSQDEQGVASSTRQFFLLVGNTLGVALLGLVLTTSYVSEFAEESRGVAATIPEATYVQFNDPTLALDTARYEIARDSIRSTPNGETTLELVLAAQRESVATAIDRVFMGTFLTGLCVFLLAVTIPEFKLRGSFDVDRPVVEAV
jgi:MFS family permease